MKIYGIEIFVVLDVNMMIPVRQTEQIINLDHSLYFEGKILLRTVPHSFFQTVLSFFSP